MLFCRATAKFGIALFCRATAKFGIAKVAKRFVQQRQSMVSVREVKQWLSLAKYSKGIDLLRYTLFSNGKVWSGCARQCEGKVMRDAAVQWLCIVALCEGEGWLCELKPR